MTMTSPWFYSLLYNGSYMVLDCALVLLVSILASAAVVTS